MIVIILAVYFKRKNAANNNPQMIQPQNTSDQTIIVTNGQQPAYGQPGYGQPVYGQPVYGQPPVPPAYGQQQPYGYPQQQGPIIITH